MAIPPILPPFAAPQFRFKSVSSGITQYIEGEPVAFIIDVVNLGHDGNFKVEIYDNETNEYISGFGDFLGFGESKVYTHNVGIMPAHTRLFKIELYFNDELQQTQLTSADLLTAGEEREEVDIIDGVLLPSEEVEIREEIKAGEVTAVSTGGVDWISSIFNPISQTFGQGFKWLGDSLNVIAGAFKPLIDFFANPIESIKQYVIGAFQQSTSESINQALKLTSGIAVGSPEWEEQLKKNLSPTVSNILKAYNKALDIKTYEKSPITPEQAVEALSSMRDQIAAVAAINFSMHAAIEAGSLGQFEFMRELDTMVISKYGVNQILSKSILLPLEKNVFIPAEHYYNRLYTPEIPAYQDLINMVVKEKIPLTEFQAQMMNKGFKKEWSQLIWDAHFIPPNLSDLLIAWRRGIINEERLDALMILVDLDPTFKEIFDVRKYIDPTVRTARWGFEAGAIDKARVLEVVKRAGYSEEDAKWVVEVQTTFQEREYRSRYLTALATGVSAGAYSPEELKTEVLAAGFQEAVADWMIKTAEVRARIRETAVPVSKPKILSLGELKKAYTRDKIDRDFLTQELLNRNYELAEVNILLAILDEDKAFTQIGAKKLALTESQILNAWRYDKVSEDELRIELALRGMAQDEINILIDTQKAKWGKD